MRAIVVDASAIGAVLFNEPESEPILASVAGALVAPSLLLYELASICATKLTRKPADANTIVARYRLFADLDIDLIEPEWATLPLLASEWAITAYDAAYLQIALKQRAPLVTLDARLAAAYDKAAGAATP
jgi:predicted nucleic acid-binding protein